MVDWPLRVTPPEEVRRQEHFPASLKNRKTFSCIQMCMTEVHIIGKITPFDGIIFLHFLRSESINATCENLKSFKFH